MIIIGSKALARLGIPPSRPFSDTDYIMTYEEFEEFQKAQECHSREEWVSCFPLSDNKWKLQGRNKRIVEVEIAWPGSSGAMILDYVKSQNLTSCYAPANVCLMLKLSHRFLKNSPHFMKTRDDIMLLRREFVTLNDRLKQILEVREKETYWYEHPNLKRSKDEFFVDDYLFDHDSIHEAVAIKDRPTYTNFQKLGAEVECDMDKFMEQPLNVKLAAVYEETCVLALERSVIPHGKDQQWAFEKALEKVCTSITSGRFREFAWENYTKVLELKETITPLYTVSFYEGIVNGIVKPQ